MVPRWQRLLVPEATELLIGSAAPNCFNSIECLIRIDQDTDVLAGRFASHFDALNVIIQTETTHLYFEGAIADLERFVDGPLVLRMIFIVLAIPTAHCICRHAIPNCTEHLIHG